MSCYSCVGCKWLYFEDFGYSNYTVEETGVYCALDQNQNLTRETNQYLPYDWNRDANNDNWRHTRDSRCTGFEPGDTIHLDVEEEARMTDYQDQEQAFIVFGHANRLPGVQLDDDF